MVLKHALALTLLLATTVAFVHAQPSPPKATSVVIGDKNISIKYCAPSLRGRKIFGGAGALQPDNTVWRAGANNATALHTEAQLTIGNVAVPAGDYTLYVFLDPSGWKLIVSRQTGQWGINRDGGTSLDESKALSRIPMTMSKPPAPVELYKMTLSSTGANEGKLQLEWENAIAAVDFTAK
ncbi:MAG TPA: DUF2911 domain-containing protein [Candidatus Solibacter sp.]|nr:DUF2911 domain-containing protein [Candidatus Solibacter sp.]